MGCWLDLDMTRIVKELINILPSIIFILSTSFYFLEWISYHILGIIWIIVLFYMAYKDKS